MESTRAVAGDGLLIRWRKPIVGSNPTSSANYMNIDVMTSTLLGLDILTEESKMNALLKEVINNNVRVQFNYIKEGDTQASTRVVDPMIYGVKTAGSNALFGGVEVGSGFKMFIVDNITNVRVVLTESGSPTPSSAAVVARKNAWETIYAER